MKIVLIIFVFLHIWSTEASPKSSEQLRNEVKNEGLESDPWREDCAHDVITTRPLSVLLLNGLYLGHFFPLVSLGEELVRRGHNVNLCQCTQGIEHSSRNCRGLESS